MQKALKGSEGRKNNKEQSDKARDYPEQLSEFKCT